MQKFLTFLIVFVVSAGCYGAVGQTVLAAEAPSFSIYPTTGSSVVQATVIGADPNAAATMYYASGGSVHSYNLGLTNGIGYLTTNVDGSSLGISSGSSAYVVVDGASSPQTTWPNIASGGSLSLSQTSLTLSSGQNMVVVAAVSQPISITSNTNPSVASALTAGNQLTVTALSTGSTAITVCASGIGCGTVNVSVASAGMPVPPSIYLDHNNINVAVGSSVALGISGSGTYFVSSNSGPGEVTAVVNGSTLTVTGMKAGGASLNVCTSGSNGASTCVPVVVSVNDSTTPSTSAAPTLSASMSEVDLPVGKTQAVTLYGTAAGIFSVTENSNPTAVGASTNGATLNIAAIASGGSNLTVCEFEGGCVHIYVYVTLTGVAAPTSGPSSSTTSATGGSSSGITFSSYLSPGSSGAEVSALQTVLSKLGLLNHSVTGYYGALTTDAVAALQKAHGLPALGVVGPATRSLLNGLGSSGPLGDGFAFHNPLAVGSSGRDVTELQKRLTAEGYYSGPVTGYYGSLTEAAVKSYQKARGLDQLGNVGPGTRAALNAAG